MTRMRSAQHEQMVHATSLEGQNDLEVQTLAHEQATLCSALLRLLCRALATLEGRQLSFADRSRLSRALARLQDVETISASNVEIVGASPVPPCSPK